MPSNVLTVICIFLPLSSLWASAAAATTRSQPASQPLPSFNSGGLRQRLSSSITSGTMGLLVGLDDGREPLSSSITGVSQSSVPSHSEGVVLVEIIDREKQNLPVEGKS